MSNFTFTEAGNLRIHLKTHWKEAISVTNIFSCTNNWRKHKRKNRTAKNLLNFGILLINGFALFFCPVALFLVSFVFTGQSIEALDAAH